jgi:hypothetical protein
MPKNYRKPSDVEWTDTRIARLEALHADDRLSFEAIAARLRGEFGVELTKNACIGKARRLGLPQRRHVPIQTQKRVRKPALAKPIAPEVVPCVLPRWQIVMRAPVAPTDGKITIFELTNDRCHWPFGDRSPYLFCGAPTAGKVYCAFHTGISCGHSVARARVTA